MGPPRRSRKPAAQLRVPPDKIFGVGKPLLKNKLPLYSEVGKALMLKAEEDRLKRESKEIDFKRSTADVCKMVLDVYADAVVPTIQEHKVKEKVHDLWRMRREALQALAKGNVGKFRKKKKNGRTKRLFSDVQDSLFDVADDNKVPLSSKAFLQAQREPGRRGFIGGVNKEETMNVKAQLKRKELKAKQKEEQEKRRQECSEEIEAQFEKVSFELSELESEGGDESDPEYQPCVDNRKTREERRISRKRKLEWETNVAETADRFKISDDATAHLANSLSCAEEDENKGRGQKKMFFFTLT